MTNIAQYAFNTQNKVTVLSDGSKLFSSDFDSKCNFDIHRFDQIKFLRKRIKSSFAQNFLNKNKIDIIFFDSWKSLELFNYTTDIKKICLAHGNEILKLRNKQRILNSLNKADLIILEGWCVGSKPIDPLYLKKNINDLEKINDPDMIWRTAYNQSLTEYQKLFNKFNYYIFIKLPDWKYVINWKYKQELNLRSLSSDNHLKKKLYLFIQYYEKLSKWMSITCPDICNILITLDKNQKIKKITYK